MFSAPLRLLLAAALAPTGMLLHGDFSNPHFAETPAKRTTTESVPLFVVAGHQRIEAKVPTSTRTVGDALTLLALPAKGVFVAPDPATLLTPGMAITVLSPITVFLKDGAAAPKPITTFVRDIGTVLTDAGIALGPLDDVNLPLTDTARDGATIRVTRIAEEERVETVPVPFPITAQDDPTLPWGREHLIQKGVPGSAEERVRIRTENGSLVARTVLQRTVLAPSEPELRARGTKIAIGRVVEGGASWYRFKAGMFAASTMFPRGTYLRVTNLETGKQVIVAVNDYGPTAPGRVIDLDAVAFQKLKPLWQGVFHARVEEIMSD